MKGPKYIEVSKDTHKQVKVLKAVKEFRTMDATVKFLLRKNEYE